MGRILARSVGNRRLKSSSQLNGDDLTRCDHLIARVAWYAGGNVACDFDDEAK